MGITDILASIDREIATLKQARVLLGGGAPARSRRKVGRPRKPAASAKPAVKPAKKKKRNLSPEGRKRIAEAVKRRWEMQRKAAAAAQK